MKKVLLSLLVIGFFLGMITHAQTPFTIAGDEVLVYVQWLDGKQVYVAQQGTARYTYTLADGDCASISPDGRYIAISQEQPITLKIIDFRTQQVVFETVWSTSQRQFCSMGWIGNTILTIVTKDGEDFIHLYFKFENGTLTRTTLPTPVYPDLPAFTPTVSPYIEYGYPPNAYLQNPAYPDIYVYCRDMADGCRTVIYDSSTDTILKRVKITPSSIGFLSENDTYTYSHEWMGWSPNGRYLAFFARVNNPQIYDLQEDRYIEDIDNLFPPLYRQHISWSNTNLLLIWDEALVETSTAYYEYLTIFTFYNPNTQTSVETGIINVFDYLGYEPVFSPDGNGLLVVGKPVIDDEKPTFDTNPTRADLILISTTTGEHTILDTGVTQIITWRKLDAGEMWGE